MPFINRLLATRQPLSPRSFISAVGIRRLLIIFGALFPCLSHGGLTSTSVAVLDAAGGNIAADGTLLYAWNVNGNAAATPVVNGISFPNTKPDSVAISDFPALVNETNPAAGTMAHYTGDMAELMGDYMGTNAGTNGTVTLSGLKKDTLYRVQFLHHQDVNGGNQRTMQVLFGTGPSTTGSFDCGDNTGYLTSIVFTADAAFQTFALSPAGGSRAMLNGVILHEIKLHVAAPVSRQVIQRDAANTADIPISGTVTVSADSIEARAVVMAGSSNNGTTTAWTPIDTTIDGNAFSGTLPDVPAGGWYQIEVRSVVGGVPDQSFTVARVGVGDVYLTAGQSNSANRGIPAYSPNEDRFSALHYNTGAWSLATDPMPGASTPATAYQGSPWSRFGEMLVDRDNIPVALVCFAEGGSDVTRWLPANNDLYPRVRSAVKRFPLNGFKGILWHQGETNSLNANTAAQYQSSLSTVIAQSRVDAGWTVPWYVAEASRINAGLAKEEPIVAGQRATIYGDPHTFAGPVTDNFHQEGKISDDTVHFNAAGLYDHAAQWAEILGGNPALTPKNANFESNPVLTDGTRAVIDNAATTSPSVIAWRGLNAANTAAATTNTYGYYNPNSAYYLNADDAVNGGVLPHMSGKHVAFLEDSAENACFLQTRRALLTANTEYTLTVAIGVRSIETTTSFGSATIELLADGNVIASRTIDRAELNTLNAGNAAGTFTDIALTATTGWPVASGQAVSIRIRKPGGAGTYLDFDNVRLTTTTVSDISNQSWKINGATELWNNDDLNWDGGVKWTADNNAFFIGSGESITVSDVAADHLSFTGNGYSLSGGTIHLNNAGSSVAVSGGVSATIGSNITGSTGIAKTGAGTLVITGSNTFTSATTITDGTLEIRGTGTLGSGTYAAAIANSGTLMFNSSAAQTLSGTISGTGPLVKQGTGMLTLSGTKSYTGHTVINEGILELKGSAGSNTTNYTGNGTLRLSSVGGVHNWNANATMGAGFTGVLDIRTLNTSTDRVHLLGDTTHFTSNLGDLNVGDTTAIYINSSNLQFDALTGGGIIGNNSGSPSTATLTIGANDGSGVFTGAIQSSNATNGAINLVKKGAGTQTLSGINTYNGTTLISAGSLIINGAKNGSSTVTVANTATLGGSGSIAGATTIQSGGTLAPGNSVGNTTFTSTVDLQVGSAYTAEIVSTSNDKITASGTLTVNGTIKVTLLGGYTPISGAVFDLADATIAGTPTFDFSAAPLGAGLGWNTTSFATNGTISVETTDPFVVWASTNNVTGGKFGDDDHDGVSNLLEFATAADPQSGSSGARAYPLIHMIGVQPVLTYTVAVRAGAIFAASGSKQQADKDLVRYTVEASADLASWNTVMVSELAPADAAAVQGALGTQLDGLDPAWQWHSFRAAGNTASAPKGFIRLNVGDAP